MRSIVFKLATLVMSLMLVAVVGAYPAFAVVNDGKGYLGTGASADPNLGDGTINLTIQGMTVVKRARLNATTNIADGSTVATGTNIYFMLYINNKSDTPLTDVSIRDALAANFAYNGAVDSIKVVTVAACAALACTAGEENSMHSTAAAAVAKTNSNADGDTAGFAGSNIDIGNELAASNGQLDIAAQTLLVVLFPVTVQ